MNDKKIILSPQKQQNNTGLEGTNFYLIEDEHSIPIGQVFLRFEDTCVVITWIELMTLYRGQGYLLAVIRNIAEKFPEYQLCLEYDRKREGDYEESIEKLCSVGFEKILSARSKPRRLSYNGERCIFSKNDHLKLCEFHLPKKKKLVYKIIVFTVTSSVKEMAWYYLDGNEMDLVKKLIEHYRYKGVHAMGFLLFYMKTFTLQYRTESTEERRV